MRDFTLETFTLLLQELKAQGYTFQTLRDFLKTPAPKAIVLRHDVDARKLNSLQTAKLEAELEITGTYYFRMVPQSFDTEFIQQIAELGHEIGYHYEDLAMAARAIKRQGTNEKGRVTSDERQGRIGMGSGTWEERLYGAAIRSFESNLAKLRQLVPIDTICMHGSPLSRYDNRKLWEKYDYRNYGITGEPYFDVDFSKVMYLTDTGRRWDGERVSIRDKVGTKNEGQVTSDKGRGRNGTGNGEGVMKGQGDPPSLNLPGRQTGLRRVKGTPTFHSTFDIINAAKSGSLPAQLMITVHPQRWDNRMLPWIKELIWQRLKNGVKGVILDLNKVKNDHIG